jgi:multiple sugar transport system permease protein
MKNLITLWSGFFVGGPMEVEKKIGHEEKTNRWGYIFVTPFVIVFFVFHFWPIVNTFSLSGTDLRGLQRSYNYISECGSCRGSGEVAMSCQDCEGMGSIRFDCIHCNGSGEATNPDTGITGLCRPCEGSGTLSSDCVSCNASGHIAGVIVTCANCNGTGRVINFVRNFRRLINDNFFWGALKNTFIIWGFNFIPQLGIALVLAIWLSDTRLNLAGKGLFRAVVYLPNLLTAVSVAFLFRSIFGWGAHVTAPANQFLRMFGIYNEVLVDGEIVKTAINFFRSVPFSRGLVSFIQWWMWYGHTLIMLMAGITSIPVSLYESAVVDGANSRQTAWYITLPLLRPMMLYILITSMIGGMQMFDIPFLLTDMIGSPQSSIRTTVMYQYHMAIRSSDISYGAAVSVGIFFVTIVLALIIFFLMQDRSDFRRQKGGVK